MPAADTAFLPSVLDRLLDEHPAAASERAKGRGQQLAELRNAVRRDLEALLNTHQCWQVPPPDLTELKTSLLEYGIPDFSTINAGSTQAREAFRATVEELIMRFEPRFKMVTVSLSNPGQQVDRTLRFRIDALMYADPAPEHVSYDSQLDPASQSFSVVGGV